VKSYRWRGNDGGGASGGAQEVRGVRGKGGGKDARKRNLGEGKGSTFFPRSVEKKEVNRGGESPITPVLRGLEKGSTSIMKK